MKIYFDSCCFNRPFDDLTQDRIYYETMAILSIITNRINNGDILVGSNVTAYEIESIIDDTKRDKAINLYSFIDYEVELTDKIEEKAIMIQEMANIESHDSLHIACAEYGNVDVFLTTDDNLIKRSRRLSLSVLVMDPLSYIKWRK